MSDVYLDGEVIGIEVGGHLLCWDSDKGEAYNCGETPEQFGLENLTDAERQRLPVSIFVAKE